MMMVAAPPNGRVLQIPRRILSRRVPTYETMALQAG
jgi:hypothetical protein